MVARSVERGNLGIAFFFDRDMCTMSGTYIYLQNYSVYIVAKII